VGLGLHLLPGRAALAKLKQRARKGSERFSSCLLGAFTGEALNGSRKPWRPPLSIDAV
jgi:hypothetical protein